jgi:hypothetical protein
MSAPSKQFIDGVLVEYGARLFYPPNRVQNRYGGGSRMPAHLVAALSRGRAAPVTAAGVRQHIRATLRRTPQVVVKVTGGGRGMSHIAAHFSYISRNGQLELENERGEKIGGKEGLRELRDDWKIGGTEIPERSPRREAYNIILSMPPGTADAADVQAAAREFARREFANHAYVAVLHRPEDDPKTDRPHVHLAVRAEGIDGQRLNPRKADLQRWREGFAQALAERGVAAQATRREARGETRRAYPLWQAHTSRRRPDRDVTRFETERQRQTLGAWREIAGALAQSPDSEDRQTAVEITKFVAEMPAVQLLAVNEEKKRAPEQMAPATHMLLERKRAGLDR